jgi:hypothetical protein
MSNNGEDNTLMVSISNDKETQQKIAKALIDFKKIGEEGGAQAQADLCPQYISNNIVKDKAMVIMKDTLEEQEYEIEAYQKALGRRLTEKEVKDFVQQHSSPAVFHKNTNSKILYRLNRNLERSKQVPEK